MSACNSWTLSVRPSRHTRLLCHRCQSQIAYIVILLLCNAMGTAKLVVVAPSTHDPLNGEFHVICNAVSLVTEKYCLLTRYLSPRPTLHNHNRVQVQPFFLRACQACFLLYEACQACFLPYEAEQILVQISLIQTVICTSKD